MGKKGKKRREKEKGKGKREKGKWLKWREMEGKGKERGVLKWKREDIKRKKGGGGSRGVVDGSS